MTEMMPEDLAAIRAHLDRHWPERETAWEYRQILALADALESARAEIARLRELAGE